MNQPQRIFDGLLVLQYRLGDRKSMGMLVKRHHQKLCRCAYRYTRDAEASRDIVQDSWKVVIRKLGTLKDPNKFGSWAMAIVTRRSLDYLAAQKRQKEIYREAMILRKLKEAEPEALSEKEALLGRLRATIFELSLEQQEVIRLFYVEGLPLTEIGQILHLPVGTVKSRLFHAREKLKQLLK